MADARVETIVSFIRDNQAFEVVSAIDGLYNHMGATITDAVLQAGIAYETVVKPRVEEMKRKYPDASTTSGFLETLRRVGPEQVLRWHGRDKLDRVLTLAEFLANEGVETETELARWLDVPGNKDRLLRLRGIGKKTVDYLEILVGRQTFAIDTHLLAFLDKVGAPCRDYDEAKALLAKVADELDMPYSILDHSIWAYMSRQRSRSKFSKS